MAATQQSSHDYGDSPWQDEDVLKELYYDQDMTQEEIADFLGCGSGTVNRWIHNYNLDVRDIGSTNEKIRDVDLEKLYWEDGLSQSEIADQCECSVALVSKKMKDGSIPVRGGYDGKTNIYTGSQQGYQRAYVRDGSETRKFLLHRLIAVAKFGIEEVEDMVVHHKNEIKWDNRPSNLALMTMEEHSSHHHPSNQ